MEWLADYGLIGLFIAAFLAATVLPLSSELLLVSLLLSDLAPVAVVATATLGNLLGSVVNYLLGYWLRLCALQRWFGVADRALSRAEAQFQRWGLPSLLFAWVPVVGDPLTVVAGVMRVRWYWFVLLVGAGKLGRYVVLAYLTLSLAR